MRPDQEAPFQQTRILIRSLPLPVLTQRTLKQEGLMNHISIIARAARALIIVSAFGLVAGVQAQTPTPTPASTATPQPSPLPVSTANPADVATIDAIVTAVQE